MHISRYLYANIMSVVIIVWLLYLTYFITIGDRFTYDDGVLLYDIITESITADDVLDGPVTQFRSHVYTDMLMRESPTDTEKLEQSIIKRLLKLEIDKHTREELQGLLNE